MQFCVIGITETWLQDSAHLVDINGFKFFHKHRSNRTGGGVGLYMSDDFEAKVCDDLCFVNEELAESLFLEIPRAQGENIVIGVIYRPPNQSVGDFLFAYKKLIGKISKENKTCYIMGDFNLNLMDHHCHSLTGEFLDGMYSNECISMFGKSLRMHPEKYPASLFFLPSVS